MPGPLVWPSAVCVCGHTPVPSPRPATAATAARLANAARTGIQSSSLSWRTTERLVLNRSHERAKRPMARAKACARKPFPLRLALGEGQLVGVQARADLLPGDAQGRVTAGLLVELPG